MRNTDSQSKSMDPRRLCIGRTISNITTMSIHITKSLAAMAALGLIASPILSAQTASMQQGTHQIIIDETKKVLENVSELKEQTKTFQSEFDAAKARESEWLKVVQAPETPAEKRREAQARGLDERANVVLTVNRQMKNSITTYNEIAAGLDRIIGAADEGALFDEQSKEARAKLTSALDNVFIRDEEIYALVDNDLAKGQVPAQVTKAFRDSRARMLASITAVKRLNGTFDKREFGERMRLLRDSVQQRLVHYETVRLLTDHQLGNIQTVAMVNQLTIVGDEVTAQIGDILTQDDPLGLEVLQPGGEFDYMATPADTAPGTHASPQARGTLTAQDFARPTKL